jgi:UrcA family protein
MLASAACAGGERVSASPPDLSLGYRDLALDTKAGRVELAERVAHSAATFCQNYDPDDDRAIYNIGLANRRYCPAVASILLAQRMPARVRRAYQAGKRRE